jgi:hypothetical protein
MCDHHNCLVKFLVEFLQKCQYLLGIVRIEIACGLIGQNDGWLIDQSPRDRHALLLAAREFRGFELELLFQAQHLDDLARAVGAEVPVPVYFFSQLNIRNSGESRKQIEPLEYVTYLPAPHGRTFPIGQLRNVNTLDYDTASGRLQQSSQEVKEC